MITSTVSAARETLLGYLQQVADDNSTLDPNGGLIQVYTSYLPPSASAYWLMLGDRNGLGQEAVEPSVTGYRSSIVYLQGGVLPVYMDEEYDVHGTIKTWAGNADAAGRFDDAMTLYNSLLGYLLADINASGSISPSGSWQMTAMEVKAEGPLNGKGWGVVLGFTISITDVRIYND